MRSFQDTFETRKRSFISAISICMTVPLNLMEYSMKILGVHMPYNKKLEDNMSFQIVIKNVTSVLKVWQMRNLSLIGKITVFKP